MSPSRDLGLADAVQRDRADRRVRGVLERDALGDRRDEVPRHGEDLGVVRALAAAGDAVAGRDPLDSLADLEHDPGGRVADRRERLEPVARRVERGADPLDARLVHDLLHEVGAGARLLEQVLLARDDLRPLGAGADQRRAVRDEQPAGPERRGRHVDDADGAVLRALGDLFHARSPRLVRRPNDVSAIRPTKWPSPVTVTSRGCGNIRWVLSSSRGWTSERGRPGSAAGSCGNRPRIRLTDVENDVLSVEVAHAIVTPELRSQEVVGPKASIDEALCPVFGPLLVSVASPSLPRDSCREEHRRGERSQFGDQKVSALGSQVLTHLEAECEIEVTIELQWSEQVMWEKLGEGNLEQRRIEARRIDAEHFPTPISWSTASHEPVPQPISTTDMGRITSQTSGRTTRADCRAPALRDSNQPWLYVFTTGILH